MAKKLHKSRRRMLFGVCGGIAEYFGWDPTIVRLIVAILTVCTKLCIVPIYIVCAFVFPEPHIDDGVSWQYTDEDLKSANIDGEHDERKDDDEAAAREAENARRFAEHADKLRTDSEFDSYFKK